MRRSLRIFVGAACVLALSAACSKAADEPKEGLEVGDKFLHYDTFSATTIDGKQLRFTDYKGKLLFIDFWAAWCRPCVGELPYVKVVQDTYVGDKFGIVGISLDATVNDLRAMAEKHSLVYPQVCDEKGWQSQYAKMYGVTGIPNNYLLDGNGVIIAKDMRGLVLEGLVAKELGRDDPAIHYAEAVQYLERNEDADLDTALEMLGKAIEADPERPEYHLLAGMINMGAQRNDKAIEHFRMCVDHRDAFPEFGPAMMAYARLSHLHKTGGETDKAIGVLDEAIAAINALPDEQKRDYARFIPEIEKLKRQWAAEKQVEPEEQEGE